MKSLILLLLFVGMFMIVNGIYEENLNALQSQKEIEYKFIPRTYYDEQTYSKPGDLQAKMNIFDTASPWFDQVGSGISY